MGTIWEEAQRARVMTAIEAVSDVKAKAALLHLLDYLEAKVKEAPPEGLR